MQGGNQVAYMDFYPRPPRGGRLDGDDWYFVVDAISIHALREEGDRTLHRPSTPVPHFYPRPPRGGRPSASPAVRRAARFLSTPSARRATSLRGFFHSSS